MKHAGMRRWWGAAMSRAQGPAMVLLLGIALGVCPSLAAAREAPLSPEDQVRAMGRGVNILGYDPVWSDPARARFELRHLKIIRAGGFSMVRINLQAFAHMDTRNRLDPRWVAMLDRYVAAALATGLTVILDEHDFDPCGTAPDACRPKLMAFWRQIARHFRHAPSAVVFEIQNEPNRGMNAHWNAYLKEALAIIRTTNPQRNVVIGPTHWNSRSDLATLTLPRGDRHLIVTVHFYEPMAFTHQGAPWTPENSQLGVRWGSASDLAAVEKAFDGVQDWARDHQRPILLGEFGAYDRGDMASRVTYTAAVARAAEARGWAWAYWQFDGDFIAYDIGHDRWVAPIHEALIPPVAGK